MQPPVSDVGRASVLASGSCNISHRMPEWNRPPDRNGPFRARPPGPSAKAYEGLFIKANLSATSSMWVMRERAAGLGY
jgi:hypothetical protein